MVGGDPSSDQALMAAVAPELGFARVEETVAS